MKKIAKIGILIFILIAFTGIASATTYSDKGSSIKNWEGPGHSLFKKDIFNWYIVTSTSRTSSMVVVKYKSQYWDGYKQKWINVNSRNIKYTFFYHKLNKNTILINYKAYNNYNGELLATDYKYRYTQSSPYYQAKTHEKGLVKQIKNYYGVP